MKIALATVLAASVGAFALAGQEPAASPGADSAAVFRAGEWGLGVRPFGTTTSILAYRAFSPAWIGALRLNWSASNSDHTMPSGSSTTTTTYDHTTTGDVSSTTTTTGMDTELVAHSNSFTAVLGPEYELSLGHGVDFKAGSGLVLSWSWSTTHQWADNGTTTSTSYVSTWAFSGGLSESAGFRWWFVPRRLALAGEFEARETGGYTASEVSSTSTTTTTTTTYVSTTTRSSPFHAHTWSLSSTTYTGSLGLDVFF